MSDTLVHPKYAIGDKFYYPTTERTTRHHDCPDCLGEKKFSVTSPAGGHYTMECPRCSGSHRLSGIPSLAYSFFTPKVIERTIKGYAINDWHEPGITYKSAEGNSVKECDLIPTREAAEIAAQFLADAGNKREAEKIERIEKDQIATLPLIEASQDMFKNGLYDSWAAFRHLREVVDDLLGESNEHLSGNEMRESLRDVLDTTMRYEFVFKGFTRVMEGLTHLMVATDEARPGIIARMKEEWDAAPDEMRKAWQPNERMRNRWDGTQLPSY
jgi:hypothetical protein